jgi:spore maturation protein A
MLNWIWFSLIAVAVVVAVIMGTPGEVTKGAIDGARGAVEIAIGLVGVMALWLGMMRVAERAGLVALLSKAISPILRLLLPDIPKNHPALAAITMNLTANFLGLSNAATPLGIKAMQELQAINPEKESASDSMVTFMTLNTSGIQLIPATAIAVLAAAGAKRPTAILVTTWIATAVGTIVAVTAAKLFARLRPRPTPTQSSATAPAAEDTA